MSYHYGDGLVSVNVIVKAMAGKTILQQFFVEKHDAWSAGTSWTTILTCPLTNCTNGSDLLIIAGLPYLKANVTQNDVGRIGVWLDTTWIPRSLVFGLPLCGNEPLAYCRLCLSGTWLKENISAGAHNVYLKAKCILTGKNLSGYDRQLYVMEIEG